MALSKQLQDGKAGEHLACAELLLQGFNALLTAQGMAYDLIVDWKETIFRIQVKSSLQPYDTNVYRFNIARIGRGGRALREASECECFAFVALDIRKIAFVPTHLLTRADGGVIGLTEMRTDKAPCGGRTFDYFKSFQPQKLIEKSMDAPICVARRAKLFKEVKKPVTHWNAKEDFEKVTEARRLYASGFYSQIQLSKMLNTSQANINNWVNGKGRTNG